MNKNPTGREFKLNTKEYFGDILDCVLISKVRECSEQLLVWLIHPESDITSIEINFNSIGGYPRAFLEHLLVPLIRVLGREKIDQCVTLTLNGDTKLEEQIETIFDTYKKVEVDTPKPRFFDPEEFGVLFTCLIIAVIVAGIIIGVAYFTGNIKCHSN